MLRVVLLVALAVGLSGCGRLADSKVNPANWFGGGRAEQTTPNQPVTRADPALRDPRPLVGALVELSSSRTPGGVIVTAVGRTPSQGWWGAELVPLNDGEPVSGDLLYFFRVQPPLEPTAVGPDRLRELTAAVFVPQGTLLSTRRIIVRADLNQSTVRP